MELTKEHIINRVQDWKKRVYNLILLIKEWTDERSDLEVKFAEKSTMYEEMMYNFGISKCKLDTANVYKNGSLVLAIKPNGLWILGGNGRVDILTRIGNYILIDVSEQFQPSEWKIFLKNNQKSAVSFNKEVFFQIIDK